MEWALNNDATGDASNTQWNNEKCVMSYYMGNSWGTVNSNWEYIYCGSTKDAQI